MNKGRPPQDEALRLQVTLEEALDLIDQRIEAGEALAAGYPAGSRKCRFADSARTWDEYNRSLIESKLFGSERSIFKFYNSPLITPAPMAGLVDAGSSIKALDDLRNKMRQLDSMRDQLPLYASHASHASRRFEGSKVFLAHGHDQKVLAAVRGVLESWGIAAVVLAEQPDGGTITVIEKLIRESTGIGYALAVVTPDDETAGGLRRARQNVILELGYFMGALGRDRTKVLLKQPVEWFSDLDGALYIELDAAGEWAKKLHVELVAAGVLPA